MTRLAFLGAVPLALVCAPGLAQAAKPAAAPSCALCGITPGEERPPGAEPRPLTMEFESKLDFDRLLADGDGPGTATLSANGNSDASGSVEMIGDRAVVGRLILEGEPGRDVAIEFPERIELVSMSGAIITVSRITTDLPRNPTLDPSGRLVVSFGGEVTIDGSSGGDFRGNLLVRADYL